MASGWLARTGLTTENCSPGNRLPSHAVAQQEKATTVAELRGIKIAQTTGDRIPAAAMLTPTRLYNAEMINPARTTRATPRENAKTLARQGNSAASTITSLAG